MDLKARIAVVNTSKAASRKKVRTVAIYIRILSMFRTANEGQ
jgi:hypothetical protein